MMHKSFGDQILKEWKKAAKNCTMRSHSTFVYVVVQCNAEKKYVVYPQTMRSHTFGLCGHIVINLVESQVSLYD